MTDHLTPYKAESVAGVLLSQGRDDLQGILATIHPGFDLSETSFSITGEPSKENVSDAVALFLAYESKTDQVKSGLQWALGDALSYMQQKFGKEAFRELFDRASKDFGKADSTCYGYKTTAEVFFDRKERKGLTFTQAHEIANQHKDLGHSVTLELASKVREGKEVVEIEIEGAESPIRHVEPYSAKEVREMVREATGKPKSVRSTFKDPTSAIDPVLHKALLSLYEEVTKVVENAPPIWSQSKWFDAVTKAHSDVEAIQKSNLEENPIL
jgi:hypothetical protein